MRLKKSRASAEEELTALVNQGWRDLNEVRGDYEACKEEGTFNADLDNARYRETLQRWSNQVEKVLRDIFPTEREVYTFANASLGHNPVYKKAGVNYRFVKLEADFGVFIHALDNIIGDVGRYTDLPILERLYVEDIDSFRKVRDVNPQMVADVLHNGYFDRSEDEIQIALEQILDVPFHKKDWAGEINDFYTTNLVVNGARTATAFLLKGNGLKRKEMRISDCGHNGDQLVRLFESPAKLFVVQFVGVVSEMVIKDVQGKVSERRSDGNEAAWFLIMDGQDTARVLYAYGKI